MSLSFAKHETFYIREGWLFKGMSAIQEAYQADEPFNIFLEKDAPERLGMGRNMVRALRFWVQATGLAEEYYEGRLIPRLTNFGELVWQHDPYLEDEGTLWLLHYALTCSQEQATSWYWFFNHFSPVSFTDKQAVESLGNWVINAESDRKVAKSSLKKDVACLLRTYLPDKQNSNPENLRESPLARLGILNQFGDGAQRRYQWQQADATKLNSLILLYVIIDQQKVKGRDSNEVRLSQLLQEPMNVGHVFNLTTAMLSDQIASLNKEHPDFGVRFVRTAGLDQLTLPDIEPQEILIRYYETNQI